MKKTFLFTLALAIFSILSFSLLSCGHVTAGHNTDSTGLHADTLRHAKLLHIAHRSDSISIVTVSTDAKPLPPEPVAHPGSKTATYILIPKDKEIPADLPAGTIIRTPVSRALIYSSLHSRLIADLGHTSEIAGVCDARYITDPDLRSRISEGQIIDCGESMNPDIERIISLNPDLIMISPLGNNDRYARLRRLGIPILECSDYLESSPLGQAEWMLFYGLLFEDTNNGIKEKYNRIEARYDSIKTLAATQARKPRVIMDAIYSGAWSVPGGQSTIGRLIEDAGGINPFAYIKRSGGIPLPPERVLAEAGDADIWLLRYNQKQDKTLPELSRDAPLNSQFKAFKMKHVYGCNTDYIPFFDETPFRPDLLLEDLHHLFTLDLSSTDSLPSLRYFRPLQP